MGASGYYHKAIACLDRKGDLIGEVIGDEASGCFLYESFRDGLFPVCPPESLVEGYAGEYLDTVFHRTDRKAAGKGEALIPACREIGVSQAFSCILAFEESIADV